MAYEATYPQQMQDAWSHVFAHAWKNQVLLDDLRQDPTKLINNAAEGNRYPEIQEYAILIRKGGEGTFPLPNPPEALKNDSIEKISAFFSHHPGVCGIMRMS
ncbi:hypothetical protein BGP_0944 [Beggiatoa sp. PS]|nr:hypothetical protein BGP_0944 [Beggiatoa sp. PS]